MQKPRRRRPKPRRGPTHNDDEEEGETSPDKVLEAEDEIEEGASQKPRKRRPRPRGKEKEGLLEELARAEPKGKSGPEKVRIFPAKDIPLEHAGLDPLDKLRNPRRTHEKSNHPRVIPDENARLSPMEKLRTHYPEPSSEGTVSMSVLRVALKLFQ